MWLLKRPQTELAATSSPADVASVCDIRFAQSQCIESHPPAEPARNSGQICPKMGGLSQAHMWFQGEQWKDILFREEVWGNIIHPCLSHFDDKETSISRYLWEMILFLIVKSQETIFLQTVIKAGLCETQTDTYTTSARRVNQLFLEILQKIQERHIFLTKYQDVYIPRCHCLLRICLGTLTGI